LPRIHLNFGLQEIDAIKLSSGILVQSPEVAWGVDLFKEKIKEQESESGVDEQVESGRGGGVGGRLGV